jgi:hypothetical protein
MHYHVKLLPDGRWGIYEGFTLLASIACSESAETIAETLKKRHSKQLQDKDRQSAEKQPFSTVVHRKGVRRTAAHRARRSKKTTDQAAAN